MQAANTREMIFPVARLIAILTEVMTLDPGDVILTGTPAGVGMARKPPRWLRPGDVVRVEIDRIGVLEILSSPKAKDQAEANKKTNHPLAPACSLHGWRRHRLLCLRPYWGNAAYIESNVCATREKSRFFASLRMTQRRAQNDTANRLRMTRIRRKRTPSRRAA